MKIAIYYSAEKKDIIVVAGEVAETGATAVCIDGIKGGSLDTEDGARAVIPDIVEEVESAGFVLFLLNGGALNNDLSDKPYKLLGVYDA